AVAPASAGRSGAILVADRIIGVTSGEDGLTTTAPSQTSASGELLCMGVQGTQAANQRYAGLPAAINASPGVSKHSCRVLTDDHRLGEELALAEPAQV